MKLSGLHRLFLMEGQDVYLVCDALGDGGLMVFEDAEQVGTELVSVKGFTIYFFVNRLDMPGYLYYCVLLANPEGTAMLVPIKFNGDVPDFHSMGLEVTKTPQGKVIHTSVASFNALDGEEWAFKVKSGNWVDNRPIYHAIGCMRHLGVIEQYTSRLLSLKEPVEELENQLHQTYGTYGSLIDALVLTFQRIRFAIHFFCIAEAIPTLEQNLGEDDVCFGALLPSLERSCEIEEIRHLVPIFGQNDSPFLVLINYLRFVFNALKRFEPSLKSIDDHNEIQNALHDFQSSVGVIPGCCDVKTVRKLVIWANVAKCDPLPVLAMAGIRMSIRKEADFPMLPPMNVYSASDVTRMVTTELNQAISSTPDPKAKIEWMNTQIDMNMEAYETKCVALMKRLAAAEKRVDELAIVLKQIMKESALACGCVESASKTLATVYEAQSKIQIKFDYLRSKLHTEQQNTRIVVIISIVLTLFGLVRMFLEKKLTL